MDSVSSRLANIQIGPTIVRIALALVFIWFGMQQLTNTGAWLSFVPDFAMSISHLSAGLLVHFNGAFEIVFGLALFAGFFTRTSALLLGLHLFGITITLGLSPIGVRDFGLALATISLVFSGAGMWAVDKMLDKDR